MPHAAPFRILVLAALAALAGCSPPQPPDKEQPPEPIAGTAAPASAQDPTALRRAIEQPIDKVKSAQDATAAAQQAQEDALDAATGD